MINHTTVPARAQLRALVLVVGLALLPPLHAQTQPITRGLRMLTLPSRSLAESVRSEIQQGAFFGRMAREHSIDALGSAGGYMGRVRPRDLRPDFQQALEGLEPGAVSPIVEVDGDYVILQFVTDAGQLWRELRDEGREALTDGDLQEAVDAFREAVEVADAFPETDYRRAQSLNNLGAVQYSRGNVARATELFEEAIEIMVAAVGESHPDVASGMANLADAYRLAGRLSEAESCLRDALRIRESLEQTTPDVLARTTGNLARILQLEDRPDEALAYYDQALSIWEQNGGITTAERAEVLLARGSIRESLERYADAESDYRRAHGVFESELGPLDPATVDAMARTGNLAHRTGRYADASEISTRLLTLRFGEPPEESPLPVLEPFTDLLATSTFRDGDFERLRAEFETTVADSNLPGNTYLFMSDLFGEADMDAEALLVLESIRPKFPGSRLIEYEVGEALAGAGRNAEAISSFRTALQIPPPPGLPALENAAELSMIWRRMGDMHVGNSDFDDAAEAFDNAIDLDEDNAEARIGRAGVHLVYNEVDAALEQYAAVTSGEVEHIRALVGQAEALVQGQRFAEAIDVADRVLEIDPGNARALFHRGTALLRSGDPASAESDLAHYRELEAESRAAEELSRAVLVIGQEADDALQGADPERAVDILRAAIDTYPDALPLYLDLGIALLKLERGTDAVRVLEQIAARDLSQDFVFHRVIGEAYAAVGENARHEEHRSRFLARLLSQLSARVG